MPEIQNSGSNAKMVEHINANDVNRKFHLQCFLMISNCNQHLELNLELGATSKNNQKKKNVRVNQVIHVVVYVKKIRTKKDSWTIS